MRVRVRLFAVLRERAGRDEIEVELPPGATASEALQAAAVSTGIGEVADRMALGFAVNREYVSGDTALAEGDEVALIPPISGGVPHARVTGEALKPDALARAVGSPRAGAIVTFHGTTRDVPRLEYEAYAEMATDRIRAILDEAITRHGLESAAAEHRVGAVPLGEPSVVVAASAAHRQQAFDGAREIIDRIKSEAPIWKREVDEDAGTAEWVEGSPPPGSPA